jgi:hypothetical protein
MTCVREEFRLLSSDEIIREGDRVALPVHCGTSFAFTVHPNFHGHPRSDAHFDVARPVKSQEDLSL